MEEFLSFPLDKPDGVRYTTYMKTSEYTTALRLLEIASLIGEASLGSKRQRKNVQEAANDKGIKINIVEEVYGWVVRIKEDDKME